MSWMLPIWIRVTTILLVVIRLSSGTFVHGAEPDSVESENALNRFHKAIQNPIGFRPTLDLAAFDFLDQLDDLRQRRLWNRLFRLVDSKLESVRNQLVITHDGVWITAADYCARLFRELPTGGKDSIRIYIDGRAKLAYESMAHKNDLQTLLSYHRKYYFSSFGDRIANELGDALFQNGKYPDAFETWQPILDDHPASKLSEPRLLVKQALALWKAKDRSGFEKLRLEITHRFPSAVIQLGQQKQSAISILSTLQTRPRAEQNEHQEFVFRPDDNMRWKWSLFLHEFLRRDTTLPGFATDGNVCLVNFGRRAGGYDYTTGKLQWVIKVPSSTSSEVNANRLPEIRIRQLGLRIKSSQVPRIAPPQFSDPIANGGRFFLTTRPGELGEQPVLAAIDAKTGKLIWTSSDRLKDFRVASDPVVFQNLLLCLIQNRNADQLYLAALHQADGQTLWRLQLGSIPSLGTMFGHWSMGDILVDEHNLVINIANAILSVNLLDRTIRWMCRFDEAWNSTGATISVQRHADRPRITGRRIIGYRSPGNILRDGQDIVVYDEFSRRLYCLNNAGKTLRWAKTNIDVQSLSCIWRGSICLLTDQGVTAIDLQTGDEQWSTPAAQNFGRATRLNNRLLIPSEKGIHLIRLDDTTSSLIRNLPEVGSIQKILVRDETCLFIANDNISLFSISP